MNISFSAERRSVTLKVVAIGFLILVLIIPLGMVKDVVLDRASIESDAAADIRNSWGGEQTIAGPILKVPFTSQRVAADGSAYAEEHVAFMLAESSTTNAVATTEIRYRGIHEVPVFAADVKISASFNLELLCELGIEPSEVTWSDARILIGISDLAAINEIPILKSGGSSSNFEGDSWQIPGLPPQLSANVEIPLQSRADPGVFSVDLSLLINGTGSLQFAPLADTAKVNTSANWSSPSFSGRRLPAVREITADGFTASWQASSLGRKLPSRWVDNELRPDVDANNVFGVRFMQPVGLYQQMFRALKYAVMFIGLTFVTYFLMETVANLRLHPLQYLLVGFSNSLFYLLLLSLAEHIGFGWAYILSLLASTALIVGYSLTVLGSYARAAAMFLVLVGLYAFLYLTLTAETYALLAGSVGLWLVLAAVMYLTRNINWYSQATDHE